ncbi:MAG TPA: hypothetical protein VK196_03715 [Magnetospirillum sp.]|nr:hypothetical protein [Magnetospirillum sp.]
MADDSNRIGSSRVSSGFDLLRPASGGGTATSGEAATVTAASGGNTAGARGAYGPRGNRMLPADTPLDQLDRRAARGTYLDILV